MVTNNAADNPTASSGKVLQGQGVGTASSYSTATYPSTAGTALNLLQSDGTNFVSTAPLLFKLTGNINSATFKTIHTTPLQLIPAPSAGKIINVLSFIMRLNYGGNNAFTTGGPLILTYGTSGQQITTTAITSYTGVVSSISYPCIPSNGTAITASTTFSSSAVYLSAVTGDPGGNAAGDNTIDWSIEYTIEF